MNMLMKPLSTDLSWLRNDLGRFFGIAGKSMNLLEDPFSSRSWSPAVDITETDDTIEIKADLPDVKKEDIEVTVDEGLLTFSGERKCEHEEKEGSVHHIERSYGSYERTFTLPDNVDVKKISADCKDGVLTLTLPKTAKESNHKRKVKVS